MERKGENGQMPTIIMTPKEVIHTPKGSGTVVAVDTLGLENHTEDEVIQLVTAKTGLEIEKYNPKIKSSQITNTMGIDYNNPNASTYFEGKRWKPSNN